MEVFMSAGSDAGFRHNQNQDSISVFSAMVHGDRVLLLAVCDGVGGLPNAEKASSYCIQEITRWFCCELPFLLGGRRKKQRVFSSLKILFSKMNQSLYHLCLASTCSICLIVGKRYYIVHTGDTKIVFFQKGLKYMTKDERVEKSHILHQCIGMKEELKLQKKYGRISGVRMVLAGSDGFFEKLQKKELLQAYQLDFILDETDLERCGRRLIRLIRERGEEDDISIGTIYFK